MTLSTFADVGTVHRRLATAEPVPLALGVAGGACLLGTLALFLLGSQLTIFAVLGFLATTGYGWYAYQDRTAKAMSFLGTVSTILVLGLISVFVVWEALPILQRMGLRLFGFTEPVELFGVQLLPGVENYWSTSEHVYSLVPMIWGTFLTTLIATVIAAPLGIAAALFLAEIAP
ncbi:MAG: phosphate ABC transporter permease subunit PstC, partial [Halohasta sp.]